MRRILFIDPVTPKQYSLTSLETEPLGGTEATVIRVTSALKARGDQVRIVQHNRTDVDGDYSGFGSGGDFKPTHVVVLRAPQALRPAKKQFPNAKMFLWCHDMFGGEMWVDGFQAVVDTQTVPIVVSQWHQTQMYDCIKSLNLKISVPSRKIYNPIADDLRPDATPVDLNKLVFFSSPHKGLDNTLKIFSQFVEFPELKDMKLYIANPGYYPSKETDQRNVINLGPLTHSAVLSHVRSSLAVLHLNAVFPETFGLVHAEANAVGIPFLSSRIGATPEVTDHPGELIDVTDPKSVIERIKQWKTLGRPKVRGTGAFRLSRVIKDWLELLDL